MHLLWIEVLGFITRNWTEILGFITGAACVWLLVKENIWTWPIGIANNIFYIFIFFQSGLYADMGLQFLYIAISIYGWWNWLHGGKNHSALTVNRASFAGMLGYLGITATGSLRDLPGDVHRRAAGMATCVTGIEVPSAVRRDQKLAQGKALGSVSRESSAVGAAQNYYARSASLRDGLRRKEVSLSLLTQHLPFGACYAPRDVLG